ncbi:MAG TPA: hypothetical protein VHB25_15135 [Gemmatimonadaceae bacterium]|nr:hypothetical protein [Gemmatimonadaceae bacterium]
MIALLAIAAQLTIVAHAPDTASTCQAIEVSVAVAAPGRAPPRLVVPSLAPVEVLRSSPVPHVTYDSGAGGGVMAEYRFVLTTDRVGQWTIPPFEAVGGGTVVRSRPLDIAVRPVGARGSLPTVVARARVDTALGFSFRPVAQPETVYVGQQANYEVAVFLNAAVRDRLRRNPTFFPPDMQSMLAYDLPASAEAPRRPAGLHCFDALVYQRALFPLMPGRFAIPPAQLVYALPLSASFFSREETHELQTDSAVIVAVEPPQTGRPSDYAGAVGRLRLAARLDTNAARVGDPLVLTVRVSGTGNVKLLPRPSVSVSWASLVNGDERVTVDTTALRIGGSKEFDWVLTPRVAGELDVPPIRYSYFDPELRQYEVAAASPTHVHVGPGTLASADTMRAQTLLALRTRYRGPLDAPLHQHPVFWAVLALFPLPAITASARERRRRAAPRPVDRASQLSALARRVSAAEDASAVRRAFTAAIAERVRVAPESFTRPGALARVLRRRGVSTEVALDAENFLRRLDEAAFSSSGRLPDDAGAHAAKLYNQIDAEALPRLEILGTALGIVAIFAIGVATAHALDANAARSAFDRGVSAYEHHDFVTAREAFITSVADDPRAPDAWANLGTASWAAADTARAVTGWQRALRMEPLASDLRDRVELVHALPVSSAGYVPPIPASWLFDLAAVLWCGAWGVGAFRARRGRAAITRDLAAVALVAGGFMVGGFVLADRFAGRRLAVVRHTAALSRDPELGGELGPTAIIGEVVRVRGRQGAWTRVVLDDGRDGWVDNAALVPLDAADATAIASD